MGSEGPTTSTDDEFPPLKPIKTTPVTSNADDECTTPKSEGHVLRPPATCPPAPRKPGPAKRKDAGSTPLKDFFVDVPLDLSSVFLAIPDEKSKKRVRVSLSL